MSGILGEGLLGDFILGDAGEEEAGTFAYGQAQAQIISLNVNKHAQAQADINQTYFGFSQAQANLATIQQSYAQAQAQILGVNRGFGQTQASILQIYYAFAQTQADILQVYYGFSQAQALVVITQQSYAQGQAYLLGNAYGQALGLVVVTNINQHSQAQSLIVGVGLAFAQAQANLSVSYQSYGQAEAFIVFTPTAYAQAAANITNTTPNAQAQAQILQAYYQHAETQTRLKLVNFGVAQATAYVREKAIAQAAALIDSIHRNQHGAAQAFICWTDTFTRVETFGLGSDYTWQDWDTDANSASESTFIVDGTKVVNTDTNFMWEDSYSINRKVPREGIVQFDIYLPDKGISSTNFAAIIFGQDFQDGHYLYIFDDDNNDYVISNGSGAFVDALRFTAIPDNWYTVKMGYRQDIAWFKYWKIGDAEPDWQFYQTTPVTLFDTAWISFGFNDDRYAFDNLIFCTGDVPLLRANVSAQAAALIINTLPVGNAQAQITNTTANGCAQAYVQWVSSTSFRDTFTRTTSSGLGTPYYLWTPIYSSFDHPAASTVTVDGTRVVIPPGVHDSYYLGYTFGVYNTLSFETTVTATPEPFEISLTIPGSPEIEWRWFYDPVISGNLQLRRFINGVFAASSGFSATLAATYRFVIRWSAAGGSVQFFRDNVLIGSAAVSAVNNLGNTNLLIKFTGSTTQNLYFDNLTLDAGTIASGQARAFIRAPFRRTGQARARIKQTYQGYAQAQAIINQTMRVAQAQAFIGDPLRVGYGQAQAKIQLRHSVFGQARAHIFLKRWVWAQAQAYIGHGRAFGQAQSKIYRLDLTKVGQAQASIGSFKTGNAQARINVEGATFGFAQVQAQIGVWVVAQAQALIATNKGYGQSQGLIQGFKIRFGQARARTVNTFSSSNGQAQATIRGGFVVTAHSQAIIVGYTSRSGNAQGLIKRTIAYGNAQGYINQTAVIAGTLVRYNGYYLPGYYQEETLPSEMTIEAHIARYHDASLSEYTGLENKYISIRMKVLDSTYGLAKDQVLRAGSLLRSNRREFVPLILMNPDRYYLAMTKSISTSQTTGTGEKQLDYNVTFECKPWQYGYVHSITGTTLLDTNSVGRDFYSGTWTPARVLITGTNVTVSGYTESGDFTGYISVSGAVTNLSIDSEMYSAIMNGETRNDLLYNYDFQLFVGPGRTLFAVTGATEVTVEYEDRWSL